MDRPSVNDSSAMLLYEAPTGLAIFSFGGDCLNDPVVDFWANLQPNLEFFLKYESVSTPIDLANEAIDERLTRKLTSWLCGSEKKLVVGNSEHKRLIELSLGITCLYVDVPDCERTLLPRKKSERNKRDCLPIDKELIAFLRQHRLDVNPEMVNESMAEFAHQLHDNKLCELERLKFFRILLKDFIVISGIDTKRWGLFQFASVPKMIYCPRSSYQKFHPLKIFSHEEHRKIEANAPRYKTSFSRIGVSSVYEDIVSLYSKKCLLLHKLESLVEKAKSENFDFLPVTCVFSDSGDYL